VQQWRWLLEVRYVSGNGVSDNSQRTSQTVTSKLQVRRRVTERWTIVLSAAAAAVGCSYRQRRLIDNWRSHPTFHSICAHPTVSWLVYT